MYKLHSSCRATMCHLPSPQIRTLRLLWSDSVSTLRGRFWPGGCHWLCGSVAFMAGAPGGCSELYQRIHRRTWGYGWEDVVRMMLPKQMNIVSLVALNTFRMFLIIWGPRSFSRCSSCQVHPPSSRHVCEIWEATKAFGKDKLLPWEQRISIC